MPKSKNSSRKPKNNPRPSGPLRRPGSALKVVGIGASAGGVKAVLELVENLPLKSGFSYVIVQPLQHGPSTPMAALLESVTRLPIIEIRKPTAPRADHVYVLPPSHEIMLSGGRFHPVRRRRINLPIDAFFQSLSLELKENAIGVVLPGDGLDGIAGLQRVKAEGGITFAQSLSTARTSRRPSHAILSRSVDYVLSPPQIAREIARISRQTRQPIHASGVAEENKPIFAIIRALTGVDFSFYKQSTLRRRIQRRLLLNKFQNVSSYAEFLRDHPKEVEALFNDLLINVTGFFRDPAVFKALRSRIFPRILKARKADAPIRVWVSGCSTGEEAYSIAIALVEFFEKRKIFAPVQIFGTDLSSAVIDKARIGMYPHSIEQDVSSERLRRFFVKVNGSYQVHKSIRDMCIFAPQNLVEDPPFSNLDLLSCRNVMIYLGPVLQKQVMSIFHYAMKDTGFLVMGSSETIGPSSDLFTLIDKKHKIYTKKTTPLPSPIEIPHRMPGSDAREARVSLFPREGSTVVEIQEQVDKLVLTRYAPNSVVINSSMDVIQFRGKTASYLEHGPGLASLNLLKMAREGLAMDLRTAISRAIKQGAAVRQEHIHLRHNSHLEELAIDVIPFTNEATEERFFLIVFLPQRSVEKPAAPGGAGAASREGSKGFQKIQEELAATKESLQAIIEEQEATNEELKAANEEIQSSNEELQSTNEELETAKEELQSTNEELTTLNDELQNRNQELTHVNDDLRNLISSIHIPIIMLGNDLSIRRYTPAAEKIFKLIPSDIGRKLSDLHRHINLPDLDKSIEKVIEDLVLVERDVSDDRGRWYSLLIRPYRTQENKIDGAVITLMNIEEFKRGLEQIISLVRQPVLILDSRLVVRNFNAPFARRFHAHKQLIGGPLFKSSLSISGARGLRRFLNDVVLQRKETDEFDMEPAGPRMPRFRVSVRKFLRESRAHDLLFLFFEEVPK